MPELMPQDKESYQKLYDAADHLLDQIPTEEGPQIGDTFTLRELTDAFFNKLTVPADLTSFEQLQAQVELIGGYLVMYRLFTDVINTSTWKDSINEDYQKLLAQYNLLKVSLDAVDDDFLDNLTVPCSDPLFLGFLDDQDVRMWTQQLMADQAPTLTDSQVETLINAWGTAVTKFAEDARKEATQINNENRVNPGQSTTIAHFFCIHDQLEGLYSELSTAVAVNS